MPFRKLAAVLGDFRPMEAAAALRPSVFHEGATAPRSASSEALFSSTHSPPASIVPFTARSA